MTRAPMKVLLSEGSSLSARHTVRALGQSDRRYIIDIVDPRPFCLARFSRHVRRYFRCPHYAEQPEAYLKLLVECLEREQYDVLIPTHEQVFLLSKYRQALARQVGLALPDFASMETMFSKANFSRLLSDLELPQPVTEIVTTPAELRRAAKFPCYLKLPYSTAGRGVFFVRDAEELANTIGELESEGRFDNGAETLVQQSATGLLSTVQAVFQTGRLVAVHTFEARHIGVAGMSSARVGCSHPEVVEHVRQIGDYLNWHGAFFLDYFYAADTGPQYLECNPRIGETVNATLSGVNLCETLIDVSLGTEMEEQLEPRIGFRSHSGFMLAMYEAATNGSRRRLLSHWGQARRRKGELFRDSCDELTDARQDWASLIPEMAINLQLLARPRSAASIVSGTVADYALHEEGVKRIRALPNDLLGESEDPVQSERRPTEPQSSSVASVTVQDSDK